MTCEPIRWMRPLGRVAVVGAAAAVLLAGCGGSDSGTAKPETAASTSPSAVANGTVKAATPAGNSAVTVKQFQFMPAELAVKAGTNVTWTNQDDILHTATSGATPGTPDGTFDGQMDGPGKSFSHVFDQSGRYPYFCSRHTSMTGTVVVE
jgi:plastocyanin